MQRGAPQPHGPWYHPGPMEPTPNDRPPPPRGVYLLPQLLTTGCLFSGFYAIVAAIDKNFAPAGMAVFVAMIFDGLDGRIARLTRTETTFGKEYDSLADMVAFGLAPPSSPTSGAWFASRNTGGSGSGSAGSPRSSTP